MAYQILLKLDNRHAPVQDARKKLRAIGLQVAPDRASDHNRAVVAAYRLLRNPTGTISMRLILGMILGAALTIAGAYISDSMNTGSPTARPMVNWDVVSKNVDGLSEFVRESWKKIVG
jgi:hypothetical protein